MQQKLTLLVSVPSRVGLNIERKERSEWRRERKKARKGEGKECKELVYQLWLLTTPKKFNWQVRPRRTSGIFVWKLTGSRYLPNKKRYIYIFLLLLLLLLLLLSLILKTRKEECLVHVVRQEEFPLTQPFVLIRSFFNWLDESHPHWGGQSFLFTLLIHC